MDVHKKTSARPFVARRAVALPTAVLAATTVIGMIGVTGSARAASQAPFTVTAVTAGEGVGENTAARTIIPAGFLLYENKAARKRTEEKFVRTPMRWKVTDRLRTPFLVNPCGREKRPDEHRRAARTVTGRSVTWDGDHSEQLIVYRDERAARAAVRGLRSDIRRCDARNPHDYRVKDVRIGDEAFMVGIFKTASFEGATVMRQGRTVALYARPGGDLPPTWHRSEYGAVEAERMAGKLASTHL